MKLEPTCTTHEATLRTAVVPLRMPAGRATLRGMSGINPSHRTAPFFGFVLDEGLQLSERPAMQTTSRLRFPSGFGSLTNIDQVFKHDYRARFSAVDDGFAQDMVAITTKPLLFASNLSQFPFSTFRPLGLQVPSQLKAFGFDIFPRAFSMKTVITGNCRVRQSEIHPEKLPCRVHHRRWHRDHDMQPPFILAKDKVCRVNSISSVSFSMDRNLETNGLSSTGCRHPYCARGPVNFIGVLVVTRWTEMRRRLRNLPTLLLQGEGTPQRFSRLDAGLINQVAHKCRMSSLDGIIRFVVKLGLKY